MIELERQRQPKGWRYSTIGESCDILAGYGFPERLQGRAEGDLPFYKVGDISESWKRGEVLLTRAHHYLSREEAAGIRARPLPKNTTVFAKIGAAIALNRRAILSEPALVDNNVMGLHPASDALDHKFLFHYVCTVKLDELSRATTVPSVRKSDIEQIQIPIPPLPEQRRIVAEIEKQFTRLEAGVAALRRVQANLKRYRAAVLKAACEGRLVPTEAELHQQRVGRVPSPGVGSTKAKGKTASTETIHTDTLFESGEALLANILTERRQNWQGRGKYEEPDAPNTSDLPSLPDGWTYVSVETVGFVQLGRQRAPKHHTGANMRPYLRVANVYEDRFDLGDVKEMNFTPEEFEIYRLEPNDILLNEGQSLELVGRPAIYRGELPGACFTNTLVRFRPCPSLNVKFALSVFRAFMHSGRFQRIAKWTTNIAHLGADRFAKLAFPLPPLAEQMRIVAEVERRLSVVEELESVVTANLQRATRLRQSILQKAFTGELT
jgi:type I restriction enzyme S subunit